MVAQALNPLLVVGATARSAPEIIEQALSQGRRVTGFARNPEKIGITHPNFLAVKGDIYDLASLQGCMRGDEVLISLLGLQPDPVKEAEYVDIYSVGTTNMLAAMRHKGNRRIIVTASGGTEQIPKQKPTNDDWSDNFVWRVRNVYRDMQRMEKILAVSDMEYVVLRPRRLGQGPKLNNLKLSVHKNHTAFDERTGGPRSKVTYADLAAFALTLTDGPNPYLGTAVGIYTDVDGAMPGEKMINDRPTPK